MQVYLVGGAVRDTLLGRSFTERDWVVVGATPQEMLSRGYQQVGKDFPVFLHPQTKEEYALARTERKTARGYHGFEFDTRADVTLEQDLARRDLTINAMAMTPKGVLVDPYGGRRDLDDRILRHVSPAFEEDPVRLLRLARFAARFAPLGFRVADETLDLLREMVAKGEVDALVSERVWAEFAKALAEPVPSEFIRVLRACGALVRLFPELDRLFGVPQRADYHPEIDCGLHTLMVLDEAVKLSAEREVRFAALMHDLGKADTPGDVLPSHHGHEGRSVGRVQELCARVRVPAAFRDLAVLAAKYHTHCHRVFELRTATVLELLEGADAMRRPERFEQFLLACMADARGRLGFDSTPYPQADFLRAVLMAVRAVPVQPLLAAGLQGLDLAAALRLRRLEAVALVRAERTWPDKTSS